MSVFIINIWPLLLMKQIAELFRNMLRKNTYFFLNFTLDSIQKNSKFIIISILPIWAHCTPVRQQQSLFSVRHDKYAKKKRRTVMMF